MPGHVSSGHPSPAHPATRAAASVRPDDGWSATVAGEAWIAVLGPLQAAGTVFGIPTAWLGVGGILAIAAGVGVRVWQEYRDEPFTPSLDRLSTEDHGGRGQSSTDPGGAFVFGAKGAGPPEPVPVEDRIRVAREQLREGAFRGAVQAAYLVTLNRIARERGWASDGTNAGAARRNEPVLDDRTRTSFEELAELYDRAVFDQEYEPTAEDADRSIEIAEELTGIDEATER